MPTDEPSDFHPEPRTQAEFVQSIWRIVIEEVLPELRDTNARVTSLERWKYGILGGLAVVSAVIVPIFIVLVLHNIPTR